MSGLPESEWPAALSRIDEVYAILKAMDGFEGSPAPARHIIITESLGSIGYLINIIRNARRLLLELKEQIRPKP